MTRRNSVTATALYLLIAVGMTWPLTPVLDREIAWDLGDPVFNSWVLLWTGGQVLAFLGGDFDALSRYWYGNIFYPEPLTIAYSEHLAPQMIQALPILAATNNVVLAYNLLFLSTFVFSGLGMFLLVRELTGRPVAAFVAGLAFAFAPYRTSQLSHLQVLSAQWMPFVLYGFRRYLDTGRLRALAWGSAALVAQNLSCGYYLLFFSPFAGAFAAYELAVRRRLRDWATWRAFSIAAAGVAACTVSFLLPYFDVRDTGVGVRSLGEITMFSADTHAFATAPAWSWMWGERLATFLRPEGEAFPGFAILTLATAGVLAGVAGWWRRRAHGERTPVAWRDVLTGALTVLLAAHLFSAVSALVTGGFAVPIDGIWAQSRSAGPLLLRTVLLAVAWVIMIRPQARRLPDKERTPWVFCAVAALTAAALALGPEITVRGLTISTGPYAWLMHYVPGFDGVRAPARYVMVVAMFLAVLAGLGAAAVIGRARKFGTAFVLAAGLFMLVEAWPGPFKTNVRLSAASYDLTPRELHVGRRIPSVYRVIRDSPSPIALLEFPFGIPAWDLQAVFYAGYHRQRLVNGYSGFFPESQQRLIRLFDLWETDPGATWRGLLGSGATHVLVHEAAFPEGRQHEISAWLRSFGATEILADGTDRLFTIR